MWSTGAKNLQLAAITTTYVSAHTDYPADGGANECSGGSPAYARLAITYAAPASGVRSAASGPTLDIPAGTVKWVGLWTAATSGTFLGAMPNGGARRRFFADAGADTLYCPSHGYADDATVVVFGAGTAPGGLTKGTIYYVQTVSGSTDEFGLATTPSGTPVDITTAGSGELFVSAIAVLTYAAQGTLAVDTGTLDLTS